MKKLVLVSLKNVCRFSCRLGYMCFNFAYTRYKKCGSLEILGRIDSIIISYWFYNYFLVNR